MAVRRLRRACYAVRALFFLEAVRAFGFVDLKCMVM